MDGPLCPGSPCYCQQTGEKDDHSRPMMVVFRPADISFIARMRRERRDFAGRRWHGRHRQVVKIGAPETRPSRLHSLDDLSGLDTVCGDIDCRRCCRQGGRRQNDSDADADFGLGKMS